jgi:glycosyltransferase involved in cell wall biosynthesis
MKRPSLSVVVPNYNHGQYLPACLDSILAQSWQPDELVVIDDASTDNSVEVIESYRKKHPHIRLHRNDRNQGVLYNINWGMDNAQGDFIYTAAADDTLVPGLFEKSMQILANHPQAALCCSIGDWREIATGLNWHMGVGMADVPSYLSPTELVRLGQRNKLFIPSNTGILRRAAVLEAGKYRGSLKWHSDWFLLYVTGFRYGICYVPEPLAVCHIHQSSYYQRGRRDPQQYRAVLEHMMELLTGPGCQDVLPFVRDSGALFIFGAPMLKLLLRRKEYRPFLTPTFLRRNLTYITQFQLKRFTPAFVGNMYLKLTGYRARSAGV